MEKITYCENCCKDTEYAIRDEIISVDLKGVKFTYGALVPYCKECQNEVYIPEVNDLNIIRAYKAQKEALEKGK
ncbi:MAG: hypothetical protein N2645_08865 [Clostridia bacterium]|nr:hypothetical protein [Clostridia bacterium]